VAAAAMRFSCSFFLSDSMEGKLHPQSEGYGFTDFERFLAAFADEAQDPELYNLTDAIFHLLLPREYIGEKRFQGGLTLWTVWALHKLMTPSGALAGQPRRALAPQQPTGYGFRLLPTPAHQDSLSPILRQVPCAQRAFYGFDWEGAEVGETANAPSQPGNIALLPFHESIGALGGAIRTARKITRILKYLPGSLRKSIPEDFTPRMAELLFRQKLELAVLEKMPCPHRAVFLTYELMPVAKAWVRWARDAGIRVIHVMHGQRLPTYQITVATDLLLFSKVDEAWFRERVDPRVKLWTIGHPRLEMIRREVGLPEVPATPRLPRIAFFSQPSEGDYSRELRREDWRILGGLAGRAEVRFRLHPRENRESAIHDLKMIGADFIEISDSGLKEDLAWCDAVASSWSTVSMEAAACGRGVFWTCSTPEKYDASQELRDAGIGALILNSDGWDEHLRAWAPEGWSAPVMLPEQKLRDLGMIGDMDRPWLERLGIEHGELDKGE
jgi:hypothetical protein